MGQGGQEQPLVLPAAIVSIVIAVPLIISLAVLPNISLIFQPLFQGAIVLGSARRSSSRLEPKRRAAGKTFG